MLPLLLLLCYRLLWADVSRYGVGSAAALMPVLYVRCSSRIRQANAIISHDSSRWLASAVLYILFARVHQFHRIGLFSEIHEL